MNDSTIEFRECMNIIKKKYKLIFSYCAGATVIALAVSFLIPPTYEAETSLRIKQPKGLADSLLADLPLDSANETQQLMLTYAEILKSRSVVESVIEKTQGEKTEIPKYEDVLKTIATQPVKNTEILNIKVRGHSPQEAQLFADTLVGTFSQRLITLARAEQGMVREFIGERLQQSRKELEHAENALEEYKRKQKIVAPDDQAKAMIDKCSSIDKLAAQNAVDIATAQAKISSAKQQLAEEKPGFIADNLLTQQYKSKLADLEVQLVSALQTCTERHPKVIAIKAAIDETRVKLNTEIGKVINADAVSLNPVHQNLLQGKMMSEADAAAAYAQRAAIQNILRDSEKELSTLPAKEQGLSKLMREMGVNQEIYLMLSKRYEEAKISEVMQPTDVQVIDQANIPEEPVIPRKGLNAIIAAILGLLFGVLRAFYIEIAKRTIDSAQDVKEFLKMPVLGVIPNFDSVFMAKKDTLFTRIQKVIFAKQTSKI